MSVVLSEGEKIYYTRDYCKGRGSSVGNVTITDKRLISTIEGKSKISKIELRVEDISGFRIKFKPSSVIVFIIGVIFAMLDVFLTIMVRSFNPGTSFEEMFSSVEVLANIIPYAVCSLICLIVGVFKIRNGLYIIVKTKPAKGFNFISATATPGKIKPLRLKPKKDEAFDLFNSMSVALIEIKRA